MGFFWILVGFVLGLVVVWAFRAFYGSERPRTTAQPCPRCGRRSSTAPDRCEWCGLAFRSVLGRELGDLNATKRQLKRFQDLGILDPDVLEVIQQEIATRRRKLLGRGKAPAPQFQPLLPFATLAPVVDAPGLAPESEIRTVLPVELIPATNPQATEPVISEVIKTPPRPPVFIPAATPVLAAASPPPLPPPPPRRTLREVLASFMEQRNIFWGELLGGMLIVGCSIALVISLWTTGKLEKIPFAPFVIFAFITTSLFGMGWYTLRHWKLESTSRGLLVIAALLVPLNFLVIAGLHGRESSDWEIPLELGAVAVFAWLASVAGKVLFPEGRWLLSAAVVGSSASQLLFSWLIGPERGPGWILALGFLPVAFHGFSTAWILHRTGRGDPDRENQSRGLLGLLGMSLFATTIALGFLIYLAGERLFDGDISPALTHVALLVALAAWPVLRSGLTLHRSLADDSGAGVWRTTGTAVALTGMMIMLAAGLLAWPSPISLLLVCLFDFAIISYVAFRYELPIAHAAALPCLAVLFLTSFHLSDGNLSADIFRSAESGAMLAGLFVILAIAGEAIARMSRADHSAWYAFGSAGVAFWSLLLVTLPPRGIHNPGTALLIYALYGAVSLMINARWRRPMVTSTGLALIVGATLWTLWWRFQQVERFEQDSAMISVPRWGTVLAIEALVMVGFSWLIRRRLARKPELSPGAENLKHRPSAFQEPLARSAEATTILAILAALAGGLWSNLRSQGILYWVPAHILTAICLMAVYLLLAVMERRKAMARLAGGMLIGGVVAATGFVVTFRENLALAPQLPMLAMSIAGAGVFLAAVAIRVRQKVGLDADVRQPTVPWYGVMTAWRGPAAFAGVLPLALASISLHPGESIAPVYTGIFLAATAFLLAWGFQTPALTWLGSALGLGGIAYAFAHYQARLGLPLSWQWPLLMHATIALAVSLLLQWRQVAGDESSKSRRQLYAEPLGRSALIFSMPALFVALFGSETALAGCWGMSWLAGLWLVMAVENRQRVLFTAFQFVLLVAVLFGVTAWLETQGWTAGISPGSWDPRIWQAYGIGLALLSLLWLTARLGLQSNERAQELLNPGWPAVDRVVLGGLLIGQAALAITGILPGIVQELWNVGQVSNVPPQVALGSGAWLLLGLTGLALLAGLWERKAAGAVIGLTGVAALIPILAAGRWGLPETAAASALRWACALAYLLTSTLLWGRQWLAGLAVRAGWRAGSPDRLSAIIRQLLNVLMAGPVLLLTILSAALGFLGVASGGPAETSFFHQLGWVISAVVPPALVSLVLVGHALRERSPTYAFGAGIVANVTLMGGYALSILLGGATLDAVELVRLLQMGTVLAAVWAGVWLLSRAWLFGRRAEPESPLARPLLTTQLAIGAIGNALLLGVGIWLCLMAQGADVVRSETMGAIGSPLGWLALGAALTAWALRHYQNRSLPLRDSGVFGLAAVLVAACQMGAVWPGWGYQTLMLGWAAYPLAWVVFVFYSPSGARRVPHPLVLDAADYWVRLAGILGTALALNAAIVRGDHLWAALAIGLISPAAAVMAVWRHREIWAFASGLGVNLAASLVTWHFHQNVPLSDWWIILLQVSVVAASAVSLLWLAWRRSEQSVLSDIRARSVSDGSKGSPLAIRLTSLLTWQVALGLLGLAVLLVVPVLALVLSPANPPLPPGFGEFGSWLALMTSMAAAAWFFRDFAPSRLIHLLGCFGLGVGILAACFVCQEWDYSGTWLSYHVLTAAWWLWGMAVFVVGWIWSTSENPTSRLEDGSPKASASSILLPRSSVFIGWLHFIGLLVLGLGFGSTLGDPGRLYWSSGPVLAVSLLLGAMAFWQRRPMHVYASGLLINVVGSLIWLAGEEHSWEHLAYANVLSFAFAGGLWSGLELWLKKRPPLSEPGALATGGEPFAHLAIMLGLILCAAMSILAFSSAGLDLPALEGGSLEWTALAAIAIATVVLLWDATADFARLGLYALGLSAILLGLHGTQKADVDMWWSLAVTAAPYVLLAALLARWLPNWEKVRTSLRLPKLSTVRPESWFVPVQLFVGAIVMALTLWMSVSFESAGARLAAPLAVAILVPAGILMAEQHKHSTGSPTRFRTPPLEFVTLGIGTMAAIEFGWALLSPTNHELSWLWLHRNVVLMVALSGMTVIYGVGLSRVSAPMVDLPGQRPGLINPGWSACGRRMGPWLGLLACVVLGAVLVQETIFYDGYMAITRLVGVMLKMEGAADMKPVLPDEPMAMEAIATVACAIVALITAGLCFAVLPGRDPLGLSERGRTAYVYAAEVLLVVLFVHFKMTMPDLFKRGEFIHYWPFIVMGIAFLGVLLSEYFRRRELRVLAEPLQWTGGFLPMLPVLTYWVLPDASEYALVWFMAGLLYGFMSIFKRSWRFALLGSVAANMGLWVLLQDSGLYFWKHPQMWLIPLALVVLVAEQLNQDRLSQSQSTAIRYLALVVIYVSSTADMFIAGLGNSWELPLALMVLSVVGVLAGALLRVRAFLYLGTSFLALVIVTMIWHAGVDQRRTWILWSAGIVLGVLIYALFMYFEKRRQNVLHLVEQLKKWD